MMASDGIAHLTSIMYIAQTILPFGDMPIAIVSVSCPQQGHIAARAIISTNDIANSP